MEDKKIISAVQSWVETIVVGLNFCPFAKRELVKNRVRFAVSHAKTEEQLLVDLEAELVLLNNDSHVENSLLIHPEVLQDFFLYNQFLDYVDRLLAEMDLEGVYQVASFHPDYQFGGTNPEDVENFTNKSPFPMLHLIREEGLEYAIAGYPDSDKIPERNIALLEKLGVEKMDALLMACFQAVEK